MTAEFIIGWLATTVAMLLAVPQIVRLVRTKYNTDGLSLVLWQALLTINLSWLVHGCLINAANMVVTNLVGLASTTTIIVMISCARGLNLAKVVAPGIGGAVALVGVELWLGPAAFGIAALIPAVISNSGQTVELARAPRVTGVAPLFLVGGVVNQALWFAWSILAGDPGTMITAPITGVIALVNLVWWALRKAGMRPLFVRPVPVEASPQTSQVSCET